MPSTSASAAIIAYQTNHGIAPVAIADSAAGLLVSLAGLGPLATAGKIASVKLTGTANVVLASQATKLAALPGFSVDGAATLVIADSAANLLASSAAAGLAAATSVMLTGASNKLTVAQGSTLAALRGFSVASGATLVIADTATNLLASGAAAALGVSTTVQLIGDSTLGAAQATALASLAGFTMAPSAILHVVDTAANLLDASYALGVAAATYAIAAGTANSVSGAQATALVALPRFGMQTGSTLQVRDTGTALLANAAAINRFATSTVLTGSNTLSGSQASTLVKLRGFGVADGATLVVADTAANLLATSASWLGKATGSVVTGTSNVVSAYQATVLAGYAGLTIGAGASLVVADTAANLLLASRAAGVALATNVTLTGVSNVITAAQATRLTTLAGFSVGSGATLTVSDTGANLANAANLAGVNAATAVLVSGDSTIGIAAATALAQYGAVSLASRAVLRVVGTAADLLDPAHAAGLTLATFTLLSADGSVSVSQLVTLAAMTRFGSVAGVTLTVTDTAADMLASIDTVARYSNNTVLTGANTVTAAQAFQLAHAYHLSLAPLASLSINDTYANIVPALASVQGLPTGYTLPIGYTEIVREAPASVATDLQNQSNVTSFTLADTAQNLTAGIIDMEFDDKLTAISVTDSGALTMSYSQFVGLTHVVSLITGSFSLSLTDVPVGQASAIQSNAAVSSFTVADSFQNVSAAYVQLQSYSKLSLINPTYTASYSPEIMSFYAQFTPGSLSIADVPISGVTGIASLASVADFTISDTAANFSGNTSVFSHIAKVNSVAVSGTSGGDTVDFSKVVFPASIDLGGDTASVSAGLSAPSLSFIGTPDTILLGSGPSVVHYALAASSGIESIGRFTYGLDTLDIDLKGAASSVLTAYDTTVGGGGAPAIALTSTADPTHGIVLFNITQAQTAADLMANHLTVSGGHAFIT